MGLIENLRKKIFLPKEQLIIPESQQLLQQFYKNPEVAYRHSSDSNLKYTGDYDNLIYCYNTKGFPVIQDQNANQFQISFLWTSPHYVPWVQRSTFEAILKPFVLLYYDTNALVDTPSIDIIEEPNSVVGYDDYEGLWKKRRNDLKQMGINFQAP